MQYPFGRVLCALTLVAVSACQPGPEPIPDTSHEVGDTAATTARFVAIGDFGEEGGDAERVSALVGSLDPDFVITLGDNSYDAFSLDNAEQNIGEYYGEWIYNPTAPTALRCDGAAAEARTNRFFPAPGNHDHEKKDRLESYRAYFDLPGNETTYSFRAGNVEFFVLDSETPKIVSRQLDWFERSVGASTATFKVAYFHHPPYSSGLHGDTKWMQLDFAGLGVDLVLGGHDHSYQRFTANDVVYVVNGVGGAALRHDCGGGGATGATQAFCEDRYHGALLVQATEERLELTFRTTEPDYPTLDQITVPAR